MPGHVLTVGAVLLVAGGARVARREPALAVAAAVGLLLADWRTCQAAPTRSAGPSGTCRAPDCCVTARSGAPVVVLVVAAAGAEVARAETVLRRRDADLGRLVAGMLALVPVLLMSDAAGRTWEAVEPVTYPAELAEAVAVLDAAEGTGDAVTLPWASYRRYTWGNPVSAADPAAALDPAPHGRLRRAGRRRGTAGGGGSSRP